MNNRTTPPESFKHSKNAGTIIQAVPPTVCIFCGYATSILFDLDLHLYEDHKEMLWRLQTDGTIDDRIAYAMGRGYIWNVYCKCVDEVVT
jgi:hypothetical protein